MPVPLTGRGSKNASILSAQYPRPRMAATITLASSADLLPAEPAPLDPVSVGLVMVVKFILNEAAKVAVLCPLHNHRLLRSGRWPGSGECVKDRAPLVPGKIV
jgi:hypothetical protein